MLICVYVIMHMYVYVFMCVGMLTLKIFCHNIIAHVLFFRLSTSYFLILFAHIFSSSFICHYGLIFYVLKLLSPHTNFSVSFITISPYSSSILLSPYNFNLLLLFPPIFPPIFSPYYFPILFPLLFPPIQFPQRVWDMPTGRCISWLLFSAPILSMAMSHSGEFLSITQVFY